MLQFIAQSNDRYSVEETVQMAIEGGCRWIQLHLPGMSDEDIKQMSKDIIELCRDAAAFLMIEDRIGLAKELAIHGVHLKSLNDRSAASVREELGPEAVIGVELDNAPAILALRNADIDYVTIPGGTPVEKISEIIAAVRQADFKIPIVAIGDITIEDIPVYQAAEVSGIAVGMPIINSKDPVAETEKYLAALTNR